LYANRGQYKAILAVAFVAASSLFTFVVVRSQQPPGHNLTRSYSIIHNPEALFSFQWFFWQGLDVWRPWLYFRVFTVPAGLIAVLWIGSIYWQTRQEWALILFSWLLSGFAPLVLLPQGWIIHGYYAWGLLVPFATTGAVGYWLLLQRMPRRSFDVAPTSCSDQGSNNMKLITLGLVSLLLISSIGYATTTQARQLDTNRIPAEDSKTTWGHGHPKQAAGSTLAASNISDPEEIVFVGPWGRAGGQVRRFTAAHGVGRVLIYSDLLLRKKYLDEPGTPRFAPTRADVIECEQMVIADPENHTVHVQQC
jgi:hypothetical protein